MHRGLWILLAAACVSVQAVSAGLIQDIDAQKLSLFKTVADIAQVTGPLSNAEARVTLLVPTNEAIEKFLADMGITADDLKKRPTLAKHIVGYHTILGVTGSTEALFSKGDEVTLNTAAIPYNVTVRKNADDTVDVIDFQGNVVRVQKANVGTGNHQIHVIDRVLYSGAYWNTFGDIVKALPDGYSTIAAAAEKAGLAEVLTARTFSDTVFIPTNKAFEKAGISLDASKDELAAVLKYHVIPGDRTIPQGFKSGEAIKTLEGQDIKVEYKKGELLNPTLVAAETYVVDARGNKVLVIHPNVFVGQAEVHVIDGVLLPKAAPAAAAATTTAATATTKPAAGATEVTATTAAAAATTKTAASSSSKGATITIKKPFFTITIKSGRKLLQGQEYAQQFANEINLDSSEQAILNAVNSDADYSTTAGAGFGSVANAEVNVHYGVHSTYADGIGGWTNKASESAGGD